MSWHPPLSPMLTTVLVLLAAAVMALSFLFSRKQLNPFSPLGLLTLLLRGAGFFVLLFIILQPARLPKPRTIKTQRTLAVLLDTSGSMSLSDEPGGRGPERLTQAVTMLQDRNVFPTVTAQAKLAVYGFDSQAVQVKPDTLPQLKATGKQTNLAAALEQVAARHQGDDLAAVLVLTDGRHNQGADPLATARKIKTPVYAVPIGQARTPEATAAAQQRQDLALDAVSASPRVIQGRSVQVAVSVRGQGYPARQVAVQLVEGEQVLSTSTVALSAQQPKRQALFTLKPTQLGQHTYQVRIPVEEGEADPTNNLASFSLEVVDPVNRLLYLDRLREERKFLKAVLDGQRNLRYTAIVQLDDKRELVQGNDPAMKEGAATLSAEQLRGLKAVIIGDLPASALPAEQIQPLADWVDRGGALLLLAGPKSLGDAGFGSTPLARLLPVTVAAGRNYVEQDYRVQLTPDGAAHPAFQRVAQNWMPAAPLMSLVQVQSVRPAATILIQKADPPPAPVCVSQNYGHGKVAVVLSDTTWRWQLASTRTPREGVSTEHAVFWQQMIDWLMPSLKQEGAEGGTVQLVTDRTEYEVNQTVTMMAGVRGADGSVLKQANVEFVVAAPDGRPIQRSGALETSGGDAANAVFRASFDAYAAGDYSVQVQARVDGKMIGTDEAHLRVVQPVVEFIQTDPDRELLAELAKVSHGKVLEPRQLSDLVPLANLMPREVQVQPNADEEAEPVWNRWYLLALFVGLMSAEWFIRRRNQWV